MEAKKIKAEDFREKFSKNRKAPQSSIKILEKFQNCWEHEGSCIGKSCAACEWGITKPGELASAIREVLAYLKKTGQA